jgi:hypothetical protein
VLPSRPAYPGFEGLKFEIGNLGGHEGALPSQFLSCQESLSSLARAHIPDALTRAKIQPHQAELAGGVLYLDASLGPVGASLESVPVHETEHSVDVRLLNDLRAAEATSGLTV